MTRRLRPMALRAAVVASMAVGATAFIDSDKTVELSVDGQVVQIRTHAGTVGGVLDRAGITVGEHDTVVPALDRSISEGQRVAVRFGRPLSLDVDGSTRKVWVTATSVHEALSELGMRSNGMYVSASRSAPIGRDGLHLNIRTARDVTVIADGRTRELRTVATTVREVLAEAGVRLDPRDEVNPTLVAAPKDDATIRVVRIDARRITVRVEMPFAVRRVEDKTMFRGSERVVREGRQGVKQVTLELVSRDGKQASKEPIAEKILRKPITKIVRVGTKATPFGRTGAEGLNWAALARCESGGNPRAVSYAGRYYGLYQFSPATWRSVGGSGLPSQASPQEQTHRAQLLYKKAGAGQWPVCGRHLFR
jgi:uncharacterized protein YabE (DUF348 family)